MNSEIILRTSRPIDYIDVDARALTAAGAKPARAHITAAELTCAR